MMAKRSAFSGRQDLSMGMLLIRTERNPGKSLRFKFRDIDTEIPSGRLEYSYAGSR